MSQDIRSFQDDYQNHAVLVKDVLSFLLSGTNFVTPAWEVSSLIHDGNWVSNDIQLFRPILVALTF